MATKFRKWASLQQFHEVIKNLNYPRIHNCLRQNDFKIDFGLKIKIHGSNACVRIEPNGNVVGQKRSSDVAVGRDNAGFAVWVDLRRRYFESLCRSDRTIYIYGEWAGPGVQSGVACSETPTKMFYPFALQIVKDDGAYTWYDPDLIEFFMFGEEGTRKDAPSDIMVLPWFDMVTIDFECKQSTNEALLKLNHMVEKIGDCDPFFKETFGIEGAGEGVVAFPFLGGNKGTYGPDELEYFSWFNFKAKSEAHRVNKTKLAAAFDPEKFANANRFADAYCTPQRFEQGFKEALDSRTDMKLVPEFLKWVISDIYKESLTEREASPELDWKQLSKVCSSRAVIWYKEKVTSL